MNQKIISLWYYVRLHPSVLISSLILFLLSVVVIIGPICVDNPIQICAGDALTVHPADRLKPPSREFWFGTDVQGRDLFPRVILGGRVSLLIGGLVALASIGIGLFLGLLAGYFRFLDSIVMRFMDGLMAIPAVLLAIALISLTGASLITMVFAITIVEIPHVVRLVRSVVLVVREESYIEAAIVTGTSPLKILLHHVLPNVLGPMIVHVSNIFGAAILIEAILGFLGAGISSETPSWGNIMEEGRTYFQLTPWVIFIPGFLISLTILAANMLGDGLRDILDPRIGGKI